MVRRRDWKVEVNDLGVGKVPRSSNFGVDEVDTRLRNLTISTGREANLEASLAGLILKFYIPFCYERLY